MSGLILKGNPVSPGIAIGKIQIYESGTPETFERYFDEGLAPQKAAHFQSAVRTVEKELDQLIESMRESGEAKIFVAHKEILLDEEMLEMVGDEIESNHKEPDYAVQCVFEEFIELLENAADPFIAARVTDLKDVRDRLIRTLQGATASTLADLKEPVIIVTHELSPGDTAAMDREHVLGIITETGGVTSHTAILAKSYRIPAVLGVTDGVACLKHVAEAAMNAFEGLIYTDPAPEIISGMQAKQERHTQKIKLETQYLHREPLTADGTKIDIGINIGSETIAADSGTFDFVGLFRTEFLFMERTSMPDENEQFQIYKNVLESAEGKPVTLRTLDIGGDKELGYMRMPKEENPFLGKRALRLCFDKPELFKTQLRAALRASAYGKLAVMLPMVSCMEDITKARSIFEEIKSELADQNIPIGNHVELGIMIEVPSIAMIADMAADAVDFASIGSNDLCQYLCAVDRMNPDVSGYYQSLSPSMLRLLSYVSEQFHAKGKPLSICGEMAGSPAGAILLAGLGFRKLSMNPVNIAQVKAALSQIGIETAKRAAQEAQQLSTEKQVIDYMTRYLPA